MTASILQTVQDITGCTDDELASLIGRSRPTVQAYRSGRLPEYLDGQQSKALRMAVRLFRDRIVQAVDELELIL